MRAADPLPRVLVVAADRLARTALVRLVEEVLSVVEAVAPRGDVGHIAERLGADVIVWDLGEGELPAGLARAALPIVALTEDAELARRALSSGARAVLDRDGDPERLAVAVSAVMLDLQVVDRRLDDLDVGPSVHEPLTPREREVLDLLAEGLSDRLIGQRLGISAHTAKFHVQAVRAKLGAATRTEAIVLAVRAGLLKV